MKAWWSVLVILFLAQACFAQDPLLTKAFTVKFKKVDEIASLIGRVFETREDKPDPIRQ